MYLYATEKKRHSLTKAGNKKCFKTLLTVQAKYRWNTAIKCFKTLLTLAPPAFQKKINFFSKFFLGHYLQFIQGFRQFNTPIYISLS